MVLYCGQSQPQTLANNTFAIEMGRYQDHVQDFSDISPPILLPEGPEVKAAQRRLKAVRQP